MGPTLYDGLMKMRSGDRHRATRLEPWLVVLPVGLGTALALLGDAALYTVLPTHTADVGVTMASVGLLLSANRWIRLLLNGPAGVAFARWRRRPLFVAALFLGAISTAIYAVAGSLPPLLLGRLLWGTAWAGIWIGGNTIILDISKATDRGRWVGIYHVAFYLGEAGGALLGGLLTDLIGFQQAMWVNSGLTFAGALVALFWLPETRTQALDTTWRTSTRAWWALPRVDKPEPEFVAVLALLAGTRLATAGFLLATFNLYLARRLGATVQVGGLTVGVATLTGALLGSHALVSMVAAPTFGAWSDRRGNRWVLATWGLLAGFLGFALFVFAGPIGALFGVSLTAVAGGGSQSLSTALIGDMHDGEHLGLRLGALYTVADLAGAAGPLLAFALIPSLGTGGLYLLASLLFLGLAVMSYRYSKKE